MGETATKRRRRFKPSPLRSRSFSLTDQDTAIIKAVADHNVIRSSDLDLLFERSFDNLRRQLMRLFDRGYLRRPVAQIERYREGGGSQPMAYCLGPKGIAELQQRFNYRRSKIDWTARARTLQGRFLDHALATTAFLVALEVACRKRRHLRIVHLEEILQTIAPPETRTNPRAYRWEVPVPWQGSEGVRQIRPTVVPDKIFAIEDLDRPAGQNRRYFFLETDQGTEPINTARSDRPSIRKKLLAYTHTHGRKLHESVFGMYSFRVLFVVKGTRRGRISEITDFYREQRAAIGLAAPRLFLFAPGRELLSEDFFAVPWLSAEGEEIRLIDR